jgi:hypothetical protein
MIYWYSDGSKYPSYKPNYQESRRRDTKRAYREELDKQLS